MSASSIRQENTAERDRHDRQARASKAWISWHRRLECCHREARTPDPPQPTKPRQRTKARSRPRFAVHDRLTAGDRMTEITLPLDFTTRTVPRANTASLTPADQLRRLHGRLHDEHDVRRRLRMGLLSREQQPNINEKDGTRRRPILSLRTLRSQFRVASHCSSYQSHREAPIARCSHSFAAALRKIEAAEPMVLPLHRTQAYVPPGGNHLTATRNICHNGYHVVHVSQRSPAAGERPHLTTSFS